MDDAGRHDCSAVFNDVFSSQVMVLKCMVGVNLKDTIRRMMKRTMTPTLAAQFSYSGLGMQRQHTKLTFKNHPAFHILIGKLIPLKIPAQRRFQMLLLILVSFGRSHSEQYCTLVGFIRVTHSWSVVLCHSFSF